MSWNESVLAALNEDLERKDELLLELQATFELLKATFTISANGAVVDTPVSRMCERSITKIKKELK